MALWQQAQGANRTPRTILLPRNHLAVRGHPSGQEDANAVCQKSQLWGKEFHGREKELSGQIYPPRNASNMILMENKVSQKCNNSPALR